MRVLACAAPKKLGKKVDVLKSQVADPGAWDAVTVPPQTAWRTDRMKNMTYTQFWQLVNERRVDKVCCCAALALRIISCMRLSMWP
jgi:hypothetical protein